MPKSNQPGFGCAPLVRTGERVLGAAKQSPLSLLGSPWVPLGTGQKAGEELQRGGLELQRGEMHPGGDLGWKVRICRVCSQRAETIARLRPAHGAFIPAIKVGFNDAVASAQAGDYTNYEKSTGVVQC